MNTLWAVLHAMNVLSYWLFYWVLHPILFVLLAMGAALLGAFLLGKLLRIIDHG